MARIVQTYRILQSANRRQVIGFGQSGGFTVETRYNGWNDTFYLRVINGNDTLLDATPILPGILLNSYSTRLTKAINGNIWIDIDYTPGQDDIGRNINLIYESNETNIQG